MPYLRITCPDMDEGRRRAVAERLTQEINSLFYNPRAPITRDQLRERTTVHFLPYRAADLFIGGRTPEERGSADITVEISDWSMSAGQQRRVARELTPVLAHLFGVPTAKADFNIRFHPYPPKDFAVSGRLLSDMVPLIDRIVKRLFGR